VFDGVVVFCFLNVLFSLPGAAVARSLLGLKNDVIMVVMASLRIVVRENIEFCVGRYVFAQDLRTCFFRLVIFTETQFLHTNTATNFGALTKHKIRFPLFKAQSGG